MRAERRWELGLLSTLLKNSQYLRHYSDALKEKQFAYPPAQTYLRIVLATYKRFTRVPTKPEMRRLVIQYNDLEGVTDPEVPRKMLSDVKLIYSQEVTDVTRDELERFITTYELENIGDKLKQADLYGESRGKFLEELRKRVDRLARLGGQSQQWQGSYVLDPDVIEATMGDLQEIEKTRLVTTGCPRMDSLLGGGMAPGEFSAFVGPTGRGKTASMVNVGVANLRLGRRVLHISADEPERQIRKRYLTCLTGIPGKALVQPGEHARRALELFPGLEKNLIIVSVPNETITTKDIEAIVERYQEELYYHDIARGIPPEIAGKFQLGIVDFATKLKGWMSQNRGDASWDTIRYRSEEHQNLARTLDWAVLSAFQGNKSMAQQEIGQMTDMAMGYNGNQALTNCFIIGQMQDDIHKMPTKLYYYAAKTRTEDSLFLVPVWYDKSRQRIWEDNDEPISYISTTTGRRAKPSTRTDPKHVKEANRNNTRQNTGNENDEYQPGGEEEAYVGNNYANKDFAGRRSAVVDDSEED